MPEKEKRPVLFIVGANCNDPAQEAEFNKWYEKTHIPEVFKLGGFISANRYEIINPREGHPKFLAVYELEDEAAYNNFQEHTRKIRAGKEPNFTQGPPFTVTWIAAYRPI